MPLSQLKQAPPPLRDAVLNKEAGAVNVAQSNGAHALVLVVAHEQAGQRDLSMPPVRDGITQTLRGRKEQLPTAYLTAVRTDAQVTNYLARRLVEARSGAGRPAHVARDEVAHRLQERFIRESAERLNG